MYLKNALGYSEKQLMECAEVFDNLNFWTRWSSEETMRSYYSMGFEGKKSNYERLMDIKKTRWEYREFRRI